jgi:hypothetical protein
MTLRNMTPLRAFLCSTVASFCMLVFTWETAFAAVGNVS